MKQNLLSYLEAHPVVTQVEQPKNAKALTEEGSEAEVEYHFDNDFKVDEIRTLRAVCRRYSLKKQPDRICGK